ncbi:MAG: hypothetical protein Q8N16_03735 [bacterium]|nr:hypothetical protein [bacterium]
MIKKYTREQIMKLYSQLPEDIKQAIDSEENLNALEQIFDNNKIFDERATKISALVRDVLYGLLPPGEFLPSLEKEVTLEEETAKTISQEINRFIFAPIKRSLASLHKTDAGAGEEATEKTETVPKPPAKPDAYREPIE